MRLAFLASNNGSSMRAIIAARDAGTLDAEPVLIVSNKSAAPALAFAASRNITARHIPTQPDDTAADAALRDALLSAHADLVILSGYLRKLGPQTLAAFENKILNVHPALLPDFGGPGMYGRRVHEAVAASGARQSGATIHVVDAHYDHGPIIAQRAAALAPGDDAAAIERKVTAIEPSLFVETLQRIARGEISL
ncbi:MAG: phosphoribosylglycinamide formyltransferase [Alphaproteobacteria bacterium]|nr:phosphoribosylglycinamide formyltransferase [Alphaproteobacteria bacterium]